MQSQVRMGELPWMAAVEPFGRVGDAERPNALAARACAALLVPTRFPETVTPDPLIRELVALDQVAGLEPGLTYEAADDTFTGRFSPECSGAAALACEVMRGTLSARHHALPVEAPSNLA